MYILLKVLDQDFLSPVRCARSSVDIQEFLVLPLVIPPGGSPNWTCERTRYTVEPGDTVYGTKVCPDWVKTISISEPEVAVSR